MVTRQKAGDAKALRDRQIPATSIGTNPFPSAKSVTTGGRPRDALSRERRVVLHRRNRVSLLSYGLPEAIA